MRPFEIALGISLSALMLLFQPIQSTACTTAIISGKATPDGRPLLWKHRDTSDENNKLMYFTDGTFPYIGLVNSEDTLGAEVWMGSNSAGFSIMNSASYNLNGGEKYAGNDEEEGIFMKRALQTCATVADFERLLDETSGQRGVSANFGAIDAAGGAAYYEAGYTQHTKFDAYDPRVAPMGYIIRTNFSFSGERNTRVLAIFDI